MTRICFSQLKEKARKYPKDKVIANTVRLIRAEMTNRFNYEHYLEPNKTWHGIKVQTEKMFCSYGLIGYTAWGDDILSFSYDWDKIGYVFDIEWDDEEE